MPEGAEARRWLVATAVTAAAVTAALWWAAAELPFFSDDWQHLVNTRRLPAWWSAFDPALEPFRPLQHLYFRFLNAAEVASPAAARLPLYVLHAVAAVLLHQVCRGFGATPRGAFAGAVLFLLLPSAKVLSWPAAIGWPGRLVCVLLAMLAVQRHLRAPSRWTAVWTTACTLVAAGFHQNAITLPAMLLLVALSVHGWRSWPRQLREPWLLGPAAVVVALVLVSWLCREHHPGGVHPQAIAANVAKATLVFAPQPLRIPLLDALRSGMPAVLFAGAGILAVVAAWCWLFVAAGPRMRWMLLAIGLELLLPIVGTGFVPRYAYVAGALLCPVLLAAAAGARRKGAMTVIVLLAIAWANDHVQDVRLLHRTAHDSNELLADIHRATAALAPGEKLTVIDTLYIDGPERDLLVFNYGLMEALRRIGIADRVVAFRRERGWFSSDLPWLSDLMHTALSATRSPILVWSPATRRYEPPPRTGR